MTQDKVAWYENIGHGLFSNQKEITVTADFVQSVHAADLDNDNDLDVLSASENGITLYKNDGSGHFNQSQLISTLPGSFLDTADFDGDGDLDVLSASSGLDIIAWFKNE